MAARPTNSRRGVAWTETLPARRPHMDEYSFRPCWPRRRDALEWIRKPRARAKMLMLLSDHDIDAAVQHAAIEQERLEIVCCPECLSGRLARRLAMIAPLFGVWPHMIEALIARAAADAVQDVVEGKCPG